MNDLLFCNKQRLKDIGLLLIRVGVGLIFIKHGWGKVNGGEQTWLWLGNSMALFGITFMPTYWGLAAALSEFVGGICLVFGFLTRVAAFFLSCVMVVASYMHFVNGDPFTKIGHPLSLLFVFVGLMVAGAGKYSIDHKIIN